MKRDIAGQLAASASALEGAHKLAQRAAQSERAKLRDAAKLQRLAQAEILQLRRTLEGARARNRMLERQLDLAGRVL